MDRKITTGKGQFFSPKATATKLEGWREIVRSEKTIVRSILLNQGTMRCAKVLPFWSNFMATKYCQDMCQYLDSAMIQKYRAWWELLIECNCNQDTQKGQKALELVWMILFAEAMKTRIAKEINLSGLIAEHGMETFQKVQTAIRSRYKLLVMGSKNIDFAG